MNMIKCIHIYIFYIYIYIHIYIYIYIYIDIYTHKTEGCEFNHFALEPTLQVKLQEN